MSLASSKNVVIQTVKSGVRSFGSKRGPRGSRGHGWYIKYRAGLGGRHLQGEYHDRESLQECQKWNDSILQMGSTKIFLEITAEPKTQTVTTNLTPVPALDSLTGDRYRLEMELAQTIMPETTQNFVDLLKNYKGTRLYRVEKSVGVNGGDVVTNTGKLGRASKGNPLTMEISDPLAMWHVPGTISMVVPKVGEIDSRFLLVTTLAQHLDGIHRAFGRLTPESLDIVRDWQENLLTRYGVPTALDLVVSDCGLVEETEQVAA